ncbi:profilin-1-like [Centropristis striata]|uniref:profilin-1-like n=1 Tax=Centropristis striata TaxID=184440 RepID=UPI0027E1BADD|nr:profilin-1-like [Centropristis striata]
MFAVKLRGQWQQLHLAPPPHPVTLSGRERPHYKTLCFLLLPSLTALTAQTHLYRIMSSSWDAYVQKLLTEKSITDAAIVGFAPGTESVWASTPSLACITPDEIKKLCGDSSAMLECGPKVAGKKCMMLRDDRKDPRLYCMQLKMSQKDGGYSICVGVTNTVLVNAASCPAGQPRSHQLLQDQHLNEHLWRKITALVIAVGGEGVGGGQMTDHVFTQVDFLRTKGF